MVISDSMRIIRKQNGYEENKRKKKADKTCIEFKEKIILDWLIIWSFKAQLLR